MTRLHKFLRLSLNDQGLLVTSLITVILMRLALSFLPLPRLLAVSIGKQSGSGITDTGCVLRVAWAVKAASRYVPLATCLTQALAAKTILNRKGIPAQLHIGVAKGEGGNLEAHAWLEAEGTVVVGDLEDLSRYAPLAPNRPRAGLGTRQRGPSSQTYGI